MPRVLEESDVSIWRAKLMLIVAYLAAACFLTTPAFATPATNAAMFRACADVERREGSAEYAELFDRAADAIGGVIPAPIKVSRLTCLGLLPVAEIYVPISEDD